MQAASEVLDRKHVSHALHMVTHCEAIISLLSKTLVEGDGGPFRDPFEINDEHCGRQTQSMQATWSQCKSNL